MFFNQKSKILLIIMLVSLFVCTAHCVGYADENTVTIEFRDGDTLLSENVVSVGGNPVEIPTLDSEGNKILAWVVNGTAIRDISSLSVSEDAVCTVWKAPALNLDEHKPYMRGERGIFRPKDFLTRREFCTMLGCIYNLTDNGCWRLFEDVPYTYDYATDIYLAVSSGMISGQSDGKFRPDAFISKAEFIAALCKIYETPYYTPSFTDTMGHWANNQLEYAFRHGWTDPLSDGSFRPDDPITRQDAASIVNRMMGRSSFASKTAMHYNNINPFYDVSPDSWHYCDIMEATVPHKSTGTHFDETWYDFTYVPSGFGTGIANVYGRGMYVDKNGQFRRLAPNAFAEIDGKTYYTGSDGCIDLGMVGAYEINGGLYAFGNDHALIRNAYYGNCYFGADGRYTCGNSELDALVDGALAACVNDRMTQPEKLRAAYLYIRDNYTYLSRDHQPRGSTAFVAESAEFMFRNAKGNCYCFASCFLLMARRIGYTGAYIVSGGVGTKNSDHAWVMINSNIYDVELEYAYRYRYEKKKNYNLYDMSIYSTPFPYHFPN